MKNQIQKDDILNELRALNELESVHTGPASKFQRAVLMVKNGDFDADIASFESIRVSEAADLILELMEIRNTEEDI